MDIKPFILKLVDGEIVLSLKPSGITHPISNNIGALSYEISDGKTLITRMGIIRKQEDIVDIASITNIKIGSKSLLRQLSTFGTKDITFHTQIGKTTTWTDVPNPKNVKNVILALKKSGPECLLALPEYKMHKDKNLNLALGGDASLYNLVINGTNPKEVYWPLYERHFAIMKSKADYRGYIGEMKDVAKALKNDRISATLMTICIDLEQNINEL